jgi:hypothetical protein
MDQQPLQLPPSLGQGHTSVAQLRQAIESFIEAYNKSATPFEWKKGTLGRWRSGA